MHGAGLPCQASVYRALLGDQDGFFGNWEVQLCHVNGRLTAYDSSLILVWIFNMNGKMNGFSQKLSIFQLILPLSQGFEKRFFQR